MAKDERVVTVDEVRAAWHWSENPGNPERIYAYGRSHGVEPDAVDVFGRPAYSPAAIAKWARERDRRAREADRAAAEAARVRAESDAWAARRAEAVRKAREAEARKLGGGSGADFTVGLPLLSPADAARIRAAGRHAGEQYERANPRPRDAQGNVFVPLSYVDEAEEGSLLARVAGAVKGVRVTEEDYAPEDRVLEVA
jgi:hypothetical protein